MRDAEDYKACLEVSHNHDKLDELYNIVPNKHSDRLDGNPVPGEDLT